MMIRVKKVFNSLIEKRPYSLRRGVTVLWLSEDELIQIVRQAREVLPKKVQIPFSEKSMPPGNMKVMIPII